MLILSRKKDEKLIIGNEIEVQIVKIGKDSVCVGIKAPGNVSVHRYEVYESIREANLAPPNHNSHSRRPSRISCQPPVRSLGDVHPDDDYSNSRY